MDNTDVSHKTTGLNNKFFFSVNIDSTLLLSSTSYFGHSESAVRFEYADAAVRNQFIIIYVTYLPILFFI